jgi:hypothetical protein
MGNYGTVAFLQGPFDLKNDVILDDDGASYFSATSMWATRRNLRNLELPLKAQ